MTNDLRSRIEHSGIRQGTHLCAFYGTHEELLAETIGPYLAAGLQQDEFCVWITSDPMGVEGAKIGLRKTAPYLERYLDRGQIEVWDCRDWYLRGGHFDADRVVGQWVEKETWSLHSGYKGLRATGDMAWLEKRDWQDFIVYEAEVQRVLPQHRMTGLCTYPVNKCSAEALLEVLHNHHFSLARRAGEWEMIERSSLSKTTEDQLQELSAHVLEQQDDERRWIANQLHEVTAQNVSAIAIYLANLQNRRWVLPSVRALLAKCHTLCELSLEQILTLSQSLHPLILDKLGLTACLRRYVEDFTKRNRIHVELETGPEFGRLPLQTEIHLFRIVQEGLSNIRDSESPQAIVRLRRQADQVILQIEDFGRGLLANAIPSVSSDAAKSRLRILETQQRLRKIGGHLEIRSSDQGTLLTVSIRSSL